MMTKGSAFCASFPLLRGAIYQHNLISQDDNLTLSGLLEKHNPEPGHWQSNTQYTLWCQSIFAQNQSTKIKSNRFQFTIIDSSYFDCQIDYSVKREKN